MISVPVTAELYLDLVANEGGVIDALCPGSKNQELSSNTMALPHTEEKTIPFIWHTLGINANLNLDSLPSPLNRRTSINKTFVYFTKGFRSACTERQCSKGRIDTRSFAAV
jgi:hypothetical protein